MPEQSVQNTPEQSTSKYAYIHGISRFNLGKPFVSQQTKKHFITIPDPDSITGYSKFVITADQLYSAKRKDGTAIDGMWDIKVPKGHDISVLQPIDYKDKDAEGNPIPKGEGKSGPFYDYVETRVNMSVEQINGYVKAARDEYRAANPKEQAGLEAGDKPKVREPKMPDIGESFEL